MTKKSVTCFEMGLNLDDHLFSLEKFFSGVNLHLCSENRIRELQELFPSFLLISDTLHGLDCERDSKLVQSFYMPKYLLFRASKAPKNNQSFHIAQY